MFMQNMLNPSSATTIKVNVNNIDMTKGGQILVMIFQKDGFPKNHSKAVYIQSKPIKSKVITFECLVKHKEYAVKVLHDEDNNGQVTKNWTGIIPAEGLGFSNNAKISFTGPPSFKKAKLLLSENISPVITMKYP